MNDQIQIALETLRAIERAVAAKAHAAAKRKIRMSPMCDRAGVVSALPEQIRRDVDRVVRLYCAISDGAA
jgi:hypothetical protein